MQEQADIPGETRLLAANFAAMAENIEAFYQDHCNELSGADRAALLAQVQHLGDLHDRYIAAAIDMTLQSFGGDLQRIASVTRMASQTLAKLNRFALIMRIAAGVAKLGEAVISLDLGAVPAIVADLATSAGEPDKETEHSSP